MRSNEAARKRRRLFERVIERVLLFCALFSVLSVIFITVFIFAEGVPLFKTVSIREFLFSSYWLPTSRTDPGYGVLAFIVGAFYVTFLALLFGVPMGLCVAIRAVPESYKEGSLALGATHWQTIVKVIIPNASSGILAAVVLGTGRATGETMAVLMVAGNAPIMPKGLTSKVRTLTMNIVTDMGYAADEHLTALFTTSIILFIIIMIINISVTLTARRITTGMRGESSG